MLDAIATILITLHAVGAALGAAGATYAEVFYTKATADGKIDRREAEYFSTTFWALRWGMVVVLLTGLALIIVEYFLPNTPQDVLYAPLWMQNTLALVVVLAAWMMSIDALSWWVGASLIFAGWWFMLVLDAARTMHFFYVSLVVGYAVAVIASAALWGYLRTLAHEHSKNRTT